MTGVKFLLVICLAAIFVLETVSIQVKSWCLLMLFNFENIFWDLVPSGMLQWLRVPRSRALLQNSNPLVHEKSKQRIWAWAGPLLRMCYQQRLQDYRKRRKGKNLRGRSLQNRKRHLFRQFKKRFKVWMKTLALKVNDWAFNNALQCQAQELIFCSWLGFTHDTL